MISSVCLGWSAPVLAQSDVAPTRADYARAEQYLPSRTAPLVRHQAQHATWLPNGNVWYRTSTASGAEFVSLDPRLGLKSALFDTAKLAAALSKAANIPVDGSHLPLQSLELSADGTSISFEAHSQHWSCELRNDLCAKTAPPDPDASVSPDKTRAVFIRDDNLWVRELRSGAETQLTTDGAKDFGYATDNPGWEHSNRAIVAWSPDSRRIATFQLDQRGVGEMYLIKTQSGHPQLESWKYAMAGDATIASIQRVIIDIAERKVVRLQLPPDPHRSSPCYDVQCGDGVFADVQWSPDGSRLAFVSTSRDHRRAALRVADASSGAVREVFDEQVPTYYESDLSSTTHGAVNWRYLPRTEEVIWYSQRDDFGHLYLYDLRSGKLKHRITSGAWNVLELLRVDERTRTLYFLGVGREPTRDPYYVKFYKVGFDGRGLTPLSPEDANHEISLAPATGWFLDTYSRPDTPPVTVLRNLTGAAPRIVERADIASLEATGWKPPLPITVKARDGITDLYGLMFKPTNFDETRHYPIIDWVYPGPHTGSVGSRSFFASRGDRQSLAELGFIVVAVDGMGTALRSKKFHDVSYGNMRDNTLPDQVAAMKQLAQTHAWIDIERAGIYGHSGGGYAAVTALLTYPDFFKVGIAESGNYDQSGYTDDWGEKFMGLAQHRPDGTSTYAGEDTPSIAKNLKGHLLLAHGTTDDNVPPNLTLLLIDSLIKANKNFDLIMLPNQHHSYRGAADAYMTRRRWDYFVRYLLGVEPPREYELHAASDDTATEED